VLALDDSSLSFTTAEGGANPASQTINVTNNGAGASQGITVSSVTYVSGSGWLTPTVTDATLPGTVSVACAVGALARGTYTASFQVLDAGALAAATVTVELVLTDPPSAVPVIQLDDSSKAFTCTVGSSPVAQTVQVSNAGGGLIEPTIGTITYAGTQSAPSYIAETHAVSSSPTTTLAINRPSGVLADELLVAAIGVKCQSDGTGATITPPAGWTSIVKSVEGNNGNTTTESFYHLVDGNEASSFTWTSNTSGNMGGVILRIAGNATSSFINTSGESSAGANLTSAVVPTLTTTEDSCLLVSFIGSSRQAGSTLSVTPPVSMTERVDVCSADVSNQNRMIAAATETLGSAGATGTRTFTLSTARDSCAQGIAIKGGGAAASGWLTATIDANNLITLTPNADLLPLGDYTATVPVVDGDASNTPQNISITLHVGPVPVPTTMILTPSTRSFSAIVGGSNPANQTITVSATGTDALAGPTLGATTYVSGSGWLTTKSISGSGPTYTITLGVTTGALTAGTYSATFEVSDLTSTNDPLTVTVNFTVSASASVIVPLYTLPTFTTYSSATDLVTITASSEMDTPYSEPATTVTVADTGTTAGNQAALQAAINTAAASTSSKTIICTAGVNYGQITLKARPDTAANCGWIYIRSSGIASLPSASDGRLSGGSANRADSSDAANMFKLRVLTSLAKAIDIENSTPNIHKYRIAGADIAPNTTSIQVNNLVYLRPDTGLGTLANYPNYIILDRCYIHGDIFDLNGGVLVGVRFESGYSKIVDSSIVGCARPGAEAKGVLGAVIPGPQAIQNCRIEGGQISWLLGGEDPAVTNHVPADIYMDRVHLGPRAEWIAGHPSYDGSYTGNIKNTWEFKYGKRIVLQRFVCEHINQTGQNGYALVFKCENQDGTASGNWVSSRDITIRHGIVGNVAAGFSIAGFHNPDLADLATQKMQRWDIHNVVIALGDASIYCAGGASNFHNTAFFFTSGAGTGRIKRVSVVSASTPRTSVAFSGTTDHDDVTIEDCVLMGGDFFGTPSTYKTDGTSDPIGPQNEGDDIYRFCITTPVVQRNGLFQPSYTYTAAKLATLEPEHVVLNNTAATSVYSSYNSADIHGSDYSVVHASLTTIGEGGTAPGANWSALSTHLSGVRS
jgi:hypothetical protein